MILALVDKTSVAKIIKEDPFHQEGIAEYHLLQLKPSKHDPRMGDIFV